MVTKHWSWLSSLETLVILIWLVWWWADGGEPLLWDLKVKFMLSRIGYEFSRWGDEKFEIFVCALFLLICISGLCFSLKLVWLDWVFCYRLFNCMASSFFFVIYFCKYINCLFSRHSDCVLMLFIAAKSNKWSLVNCNFYSFFRSR